MPVNVYHIYALSGGLGEVPPLACSLLSLKGSYNNSGKADWNPCL